MNGRNAMAKDEPRLTSSIMKEKGKRYNFRGKQVHVRWRPRMGSLPMEVQKPSLYYNVMFLHKHVPYLLMCHGVLLGDVLRRRTAKRRIHLVVHSSAHFPLHFLADFDQRRLIT